MEDRGGGGKKTADVVVGLTGTHDESECDYLVPLDDTSNLTEIMSLCPVGGEIVFRNGTYNIKVDNHIRKACTIRGSGDVTLNLPTGLTISSSNVTLKDIRITGSSTCGLYFGGDQSITNFRGENIILENNDSAMIVTYIQGGVSTYFTFNDCTFNGRISLDYSQYFTFNNCTIKSNETTNLININESPSPVFNNCVLTNTDSSSENANLVYIMYASEARFLGCQMNCYRTAINYQCPSAGYSLYVQNSTISGSVSGEPTINFNSNGALLCMNNYIQSRNNSAIEAASTGKGVICNNVVDGILTDIPASYTQTSNVFV